MCRTPCRTGCSVLALLTTPTARAKHREHALLLQLQMRAGRSVACAATPENMGGTSSRRNACRLPRGEENRRAVATCNCNTSRENPFGRFNGSCLRQWVPEFRLAYDLTVRPPSYYPVRCRRWSGYGSVREGRCLRPDATRCLGVCNRPVPTSLSLRSAAGGDRIGERDSYRHVTVERGLAHTALRAPRASGCRTEQECVKRRTHEPIHRGLAQCGRANMLSRPAIILWALGGVLLAACGARSGVQVGWQEASEPGHLAASYTLFDGTFTRDIEARVGQAITVTWDATAESSSDYAVATM